MVRTPVIFLFILFVIGAFLLSDRGFAGSAPEAASLPTAGTVNQRLTSLIASRYLGARIELKSVLPLDLSAIDPQSISWLREDSKGVAYFGAGNIQIVAEFSAWKKTFVAVRRVRPGERLERDFFALREVDISRGMAREYRGLILEEDAKIETMESAQTIIEGHFPLLSGVREAPDVRRGEMVKLRLISGGLVLSTQATASEAGHQGKALKVMTLSTKRQLTGMLQGDGVVEVSL